MTRLLRSLAMLTLLGALYLLFWPVPVRPVAWSAPVDPGYSGVHAVNDRLATLELLDIGDNVGPEHVVVREEQGVPWLYVAAASRDHTRGRILRMRLNGDARETVYESNGRPLGFDFDSAGALIIADPLYGQHGGIIRVVNEPNAKVELLTDSANGEALRYVDAVVVARSGRVYFSDASMRFGAKAFGGTFNASVLDILEHQNTGRILEYDPGTGRTRVLLHSLSFANGVALTADETSLIVAETGEYRILRVSLEARDVNAALARVEGHAMVEVLLENLPGYPDNIMRGEDGRFWTGLTKPRARFADSQAGRPWLRALAVRLPRALWPVPPAYGHVIAFNEAGTVLVDLQDPSGSYPETTAVTEYGDRLFIQSLHAATLGVLHKRAAEIE